MNQFVNLAITLLVFSSVPQKIVSKISRKQYPVARNEDQNGDHSEESDYTSEDEGTEDYKKGGYHAVKIGDKFKNGCYVVQRKLGWDHLSTVWLA